MAPLALAAVAMVLLAGCAQPDDRTCLGRVVVDESAPSWGGEGDRTLAVTLFDGSAQAGQPVLFAWRGVGLELLRLRTNEDGVATASVPADVDVEIRAMPADGVWLLGAHVQAGGEDLRLDLDWGTRGLDGPMAVSGSYVGLWTGSAAAGTWRPRELPFADASQLRYLTSLELELEWQNSPTAFQGFSLGVGVSGPEAQAHNTETPSPTARYGSHLDVDPATVMRWSGADTLQAGPVAGNGLVLSGSIPYSVEWKAEFSALPCPG